MSEEEKEQSTTTSGGGGGVAADSSVESGDGFRRTDPSEVVSPKEALAALTEALDLLKKASDPDQPWQDARHVLDVTGDALDVAGLALKALDDEDDDDEEGKDDDNETDEAKKEELKLLGEVQWLSLMVSAARSKLLGKHYRNVAAKDPPPIDVTTSTQKSSVPYVVYATQTGTAKSFASSLSKTLQKIYKQDDNNKDQEEKKESADAVVEMKEMKDVTLVDVASHKRVYFVVSTFGQGRPPKKAEAFYSSLQLHQTTKQKKAEGTSGDEGTDDADDTDDLRPLAGVQVAVAALGDSRFKEFANFGFNLAQELQSLGARPIHKQMVTTIDGKVGKTKQKETFRVWEYKVKKLEDAQKTWERSGGGGVGGPSGTDEKKKSSSYYTKCVIS